MESSADTEVKKLLSLQEMKRLVYSELCRIEGEITRQTEVVARVCTHVWRVDGGDEYGERPTRSCRICGVDEFLCRRNSAS